MDFDEIRPFRSEEEVTGAVQRLIDDPTFFAFTQQMFESKTMKQKFEALSKIRSIKEFQTTIITNLVKKLIERTTKGVTVTGLEKLDPKKSYLYISNHRDIILDSALICNFLHDNGFETTEIAIGDNLLIRPWITDLVKLNKSFVVVRGAGIKEQLLESKRLSAYIYDTITRRGESIWLAQREGRTKDGHDQTQPSLLKMLNLGVEGNLKDTLLNLNIVPVSISYEYEPCDGLKTHELYKRETTGSFEKTEQDDLKSMFLGLKMEKGRINIAFGNPLNEKLEALDNSLSKAEVLQETAAEIDRFIYQNFKLWPDNFIAVDMLSHKQDYANHYTQEEKDSFLKHMNKKLASINGNTDLHKEIFLKIYANPFYNTKK